MAASLAVDFKSTPNLSCATDATCITAGDAISFYWRMQQSPLQCARSRRPLSVDDVKVAEDFLFRISLDDVYESPGDDSGVFLPSPLSSSHSFPCDERKGKSTSDIPVTLKTPTPNAHRWLNSCTEDTSLLKPSEPSLETLFSDINEDIGASWRKLGRYILKKECFLNNIDEDFKGVSEKAYQLLIKWKEEGGTTATPQTLFLALFHIGRTDVAKKLLRLLPSLSPLSHLLDSIISSGSILYNSKEDPENLKVEKVLFKEDKKVMVCSSIETSQRFVVKQVDGDANAFAVRKCIDSKALRQKRQQLRKTAEFLKDLEMKQKMIRELLDVIKALEDHLLKQHQDISEQLFSCQNCGQYKIKQDLVKKELALLHHELARMSQNGNKRISFSGIPSERIYNLATRTYSVCEEHKEMHLGSRKRQSVCQHPEEKADSDDSVDHIEGTLMCAVNVILSKIGRRRKVTHVQSLKSKKSSAQRKRKLGKSNSTPLTSSSRQSYMLAQENQVMMPSVPCSPDWSGVPAFKMSSDLKSPLSKETSKHKNQGLLPKGSGNPTTSREQLSRLQWSEDLESDELII